MKGFKKVWLLSVASVLAAGCALDKVDECPDNPMRDEPGICGCAALTPDYVDADGDGTPDCIDKCIDDPNKTEPGECGCGNPEVAGCGKPEDKCPRVQIVEKLCFSTRRRNAEIRAIGDFI